MASPAKKARKSNFSATEIAVLTEKYEENIEILQSKFTNSVTNAKKNKVWEEIAAAVNAVGVTLRTTQEVKDKWKNLQCTAKKEFSGFKKEQKKTGGGPAPSNPSEATLKIIELFSETPFFTGLQGFETGGFTSIKWQPCLRIKKQTSYKAVFSLLVVKKHNLLTLLRRRSTQVDKKKREKESREVLVSYRDTCYVATMKRQNF